MIMSIVSVIGLMLYAYSYKMELPDICMFLCCLFFVDHLMVYYLDWQYGLNYPLYILKASWNTTGHIGFSFSILTIAAFMNNYKFNFSLLNLLNQRDFKMIWRRKFEARQGEKGPLRL